MKKLNDVILKTLLIVGLASLMFACAAPAQMSAMIPAVTEKTMVGEKSDLVGSVELATVSGGEETNPMWTSEVGDAEFEGALHNALATHALLAEENGRYILTVEMLEMDQPLMGFDLTVTGKIKYSLIDSNSNETVFETTVEAPFTATMDDAFVAVERLKLANEGAARTNIGQFLEKLINDPAFTEQLSKLETLKISEVLVIS